MTTDRGSDDGILAATSLNERQLLAVTQPGDIVVTAGAGTGKTRTLVARYLSLLEEGVPLRSIVAITFTRKAAREMRNRVRAEIRRHLGTASPLEAGFWQECYGDLDVAYIGTIHGLCAGILRAHPAEAQIDPRFREMEEGLGRVAKSRAVDSAMRWASDQESMFPLFQVLGVEGVRRGVGQLLDQSLDAGEAFSVLGRSPLSIWENSIRLKLEGFWDDAEMREAMAELAELESSGALASAEEAGDKLAPVVRDALANQAAVRDAVARGEWDLALGLLSTFRKALRRNAGRKGIWPDLDALKACLLTLQERYQALVGDWVGKDGVSWAQDEQAASLLPSMAILFERALDEYRNVKEEQGALDFDDLEQMALDLLEHDAAVRSRWQSRTQCVLVDEFQDTNARQRRIVDLLGAGGDRFIVGDAKQSIYRFRGADVTVFRQSRQAIVAGGGQHIALDRTYRAHSALVAGLNALLEPVLGEADPSRPYAVPFEPLVDARTEPGIAVGAPFIELHVGLGDKAEHGRLAAAPALAKRLYSLHHRDQVSYGDMAILFRASTSFHYYEDALEAAGIPYLTVAGRGFYDRPEIRDLLNALRAMADPTDDAAMMGLLRSPAIGLSDVAIYRLRIDRDGVRRGLWHALRDGGVEAVGDEGPVAARALNLVDLLHEMVGRMPVAAVLKRFLDETSYRAMARRVGDERARRNVDKLLADARRSEQVTVSGFLEYVRQVRDVAAREGEASAEAEGAVQIMTIHQSKGLEFPVVVLADLGHAGGGRASGLLLSQEHGPLLPIQDDDGQMPAIYRLGILEEKDKEAAESDRLLYVAATRAADMLILSGHGTSGSKGYKYPGWLGTIAEIVGLEDVRAPELGDDAASTALDLPGFPYARAWFHPYLDEGPQLAEAQAEALPADAPPLTDGELRYVQPLGAQGECLPTWQEEDDAPGRRRIWRIVPPQGRRAAPAWIVGHMVHEALRRWRFPGEDGLDDLLRTEARSRGLVSERLILDALKRATGLLERFRHSGLYDEIERSDVRYHELPYEIVGPDGQAEHRIVDLFFQRPGGDWTLVEFKTDHLRSPDELAAEVEKHRAQVTRYVDATRRFLGQQPRALLCFLDVANEIRVQPV